MANRDPLFALRRTAKNQQHAGITSLFGELNAKLPVSAKPLHVVFVHGGLSCCFDAFADLFSRLQAGFRQADGAAREIDLLRYEHDTYQPIHANAERLCDLVRQKLAPPGSDREQTELLFIAHSRGGLVARLASDLLIQRAHWSAERLEVFTYGSPHRGTPFFESEVTFLVDWLIRWSGILGFGLSRLLHDVRARGLRGSLARHYRAWRRPGALMGVNATTPTLAVRGMIFGRLRMGLGNIRRPGPSFLRWPPGIEDVRERSEFFNRISPEPRCLRFWTFGSTYDIRGNPQRIDVASRLVLRLIQKVFALLADSGFSGMALPGSSSRRRPARTENNDMVVSVESATAIGRACRVEESIWHCGYFKGSPGEKLARYLQKTLEFAHSGGGLSRRPAFDEMT